MSQGLRAEDGRLAGSCADCSRLDGSPDGGFRCALRSCSVVAPERCVCASHPVHAGRPDRWPVGPILGVEGSGTEVVESSPDTPAIRDQLLDLVEDVRVDPVAGLGFRSAVVVWQLQAFGERRAFVHIDRIESARQRMPVGGPSFSGLPLGLEEEIVGAAVARASGVDTSTVTETTGPAFLERFTWQGRLLLLSALFVGVGSFFWVFVHAGDVLPRGTPLPTLIVLILAFAAALAWVALGSFVLRRIGVPLDADRAGDRGEP